MKFQSHIPICKKENKIQYRKKNIDSFATWQDEAFLELSIVFPIEVTLIDMHHGFIILFVKLKNVAHFSVNNSF